MATTTTTTYIVGELYLVIVAAITVTVIMTRVTL